MIFEFIYKLLEKIDMLLKSYLSLQILSNYKPFLIIFSYILLYLLLFNIFW